MSNWIFYNDEFLQADKPVIQAGNRLLQYGDGLFETMRVWNGRIILEEYHFDRLRRGMNALMIDAPEGFRDFLRNTVLELCRKNGLLAAARVRLTVYRTILQIGEQQLSKPGVLMESWDMLEKTYTFNTHHFKLGFFPGAIKSIDDLSPFKTAAYLPYALAGVFCRKHGFNDCVLFNSKLQICDSSIANVFLVKNEIVYTPSMEEGCIGGVMRRHLLESISGIVMKQVAVDMQMLTTADEIFLTNAIRGIQPVTHFAERDLDINLSREIFNSLIKPLTQE